jgi:hypothetical protein
MSKEVPLLGDILVNLGRISQGQVDEALAYQGEHGGLFGDAMVSLGFVSEEELNWGLANQQDLPFVQLRAENVDPVAVTRVPLSWASENLALPVLEHSDEITIVIVDPRKCEQIEEDVRRFCGVKSVRFALSTRRSVEDLIAAVRLGRAGGPVSFADFLDEVIESGAEHFGVSASGLREVGWYRTDGVVFYRRLSAGWRSSLLGFDGADSMMLMVRASSFAMLVRIGFLDAPKGTVEMSGCVIQSFPLPFDGPVLSDDIRGLISGRQRTVVQISGGEGVSDDLVRYFFQSLPRLFFGESVRAIHVSKDDSPPVFSPVFRCRSDGGCDSSFRSSVFCSEPQAVTVESECLTGRCLTNVMLLVVPLVLVYSESPIRSDLRLVLTVDRDIYSWQMVDSEG